MEGRYIPKAFFACRSDLYKSELRDSIARIIINTLHIKDSTAMTPWKISLYHIEEFEIHSRDDRHKHLQRLKEIYNRDGQPIELPCLSSGDMGFSRYNAQLLLEKPNTKEVIEKAKEKKLNYIIYGIYDNSNSLTRVNYTDNSRVLEALEKIVSELINMKGRQRVIELNNCFYAYTEDEKFRIIHT